MNMKRFLKILFVVLVLLTWTIPAMAGGDLQVNPSFLNFGTVNAGSSSEMSFTVCNNLSPSMPVIVSTDPPFYISTERGFSLEGTGCKDVRVAFRPITGGNVSGTVVIQYFDEKDVGFTLPILKFKTVSLTGHSESSISSPPANISTYWTSGDITRGIVVLPDGTGGYVLDLQGALHPFGIPTSIPPVPPGEPLPLPGPPPLPPVAHTTAYWSGDITRGVVILPNGRGGYVLDLQGGLHPWAVGDHPLPPPAHTTSYWSSDITRGVVVLPDGTGGYVLDLQGGLHAWAVGDQPLPPPARITGYWYSGDITRGVVVLPDGKGGYVLDLQGALHPFDVPRDIPNGAPALPSIPAPEPPAIALGQNVTLDEGDALSRYGLFTDSDSGNWSATVNYGDGSGNQTLALNPDKTFLVTHSFSDNGSYLVEVCITDDQSLKECSSFQVTVNNVAPSLRVNLTSPVSIDEGSPLFLDSAKFNDPGTADTHSATINWGDGTPTEIGTVAESPFGPPGSTDGANGTVSGHHVYSDNDIYSVEVCVTDDDGAKACDTFTVTVTNATTSVEAGNDQTTKEGATVNLDPATFNDPGTADTHNATINWGDRTPTETGTVVERPFGPPGSTDGANGTVSGSHIYKDNGLYQVEVCVADDEGAKACDTFSVNVENVAPTVAIGTVGSGIRPLLIRVPFNFDSSFTDPGVLDTHVADIDWGDRNSSALGPVTSPLTSNLHAYQAAGTYTITIRVTDDDGGIGTAETTVTVVEPVVATQKTITDLKTLVKDSSLGSTTAMAIRDALIWLEGSNDGRANNGALDHLQTGDWNAALQKIKQAIQSLKVAEAAQPNLDLRVAKHLLSWTAQSVTLDVISQAETAANSPAKQQKVSQAKSLLIKGEVLLATRDYLGAVAKFQDALQKAQDVL